jgi:FkbM family methyltransferase
MSTTARRYWLKALRFAGVKNFRANSGLGFPFICHLGDLAGEVPFYNRKHSVAELRLMAEWCRGIEHPVIFDVGANNGFIATQLVQLLRAQQPVIYAFEPVPPTFGQMELAVRRLGLNESVRPICAAVSDQTGCVSIAFNPRESIFAQMRNDTLNSRVGTEHTEAKSITLDAFVERDGPAPDLLKIDVEGSEPRVFQGARRLIAEKGPAILFEWNPLTMSEIGAPPKQIIDALSDYQLFYVDDFEGQHYPFGLKLDALSAIDWVCNVFAIPTSKCNESTLAIFERSGRVPFRDGPVD